LMAAKDSSNLSIEKTFKCKAGCGDFGLNEPRVEEEVCALELPCDCESERLLVIGRLVWPGVSFGSPKRFSNLSKVRGGREGGEVEKRGPWKQNFFRMCFHRFKHSVRCELIL
jgi:hypothetical protein